VTRFPYRERVRRAPSAARGPNSSVEPAGCAQFSSIHPRVSEWKRIMPEHHREPMAAQGFHRSRSNEPQVSIASQWHRYRGE
jgi:hypothetical protein